MKKLILALTLGSGLSFGLVGFANAAVPTDVPTGAEKSTVENHAVLTNLIKPDHERIKQVVLI